MEICSGIFTVWLFFHSSPIELLIFVVEETEQTGQTLGVEERTTKNLNPHMTTGPGVERGTHKWEARTHNLPTLSKYSRDKR